MANVIHVMADTSTDADDRLPPGARVEVRQSFDAGWARGFEIVAAAEQGYEVRRRSDGTVLPVTFALDQVRRERKRDTWWF